MSEFARRGLGRGLSALLGEPVRTEPPKPANNNPINPQAEAPRAPIEPPRNVFELPITNAQPTPAPSPAPVAPPVVNEAPVAPPVVEAPAPAPVAAPAPAQTQAAASDGPRSIPIDLVQRNPQQPRKHFDEADLSELASSIRTHGVLQPILVRPIADGRFEIVAGERRWRAAQRAGLHSIPAVIRELNEVEVLEIAIVENVQRTDLNPIEEAQGFQALIDRFGRTQQEIADAVGKSRPHIANMLRLLALPDDLQEMVRDGRLSSGHARAILTAPDPRGLAQKAITEGLNVREVERLAQIAKDEKHGPRVTPGGIETKSADTRALEQSLSNALGLEVTITDKNGAGEVKIAYKTLEQLDDVIRRLRGGF
ncbi:MAG TPA: ParB/RepB/Spo0J family partition protein [Vitreimonas sp.]|uniref:ParB/RepB/Spo0J family partition protein n=1 Tax=Vitreimonas sp. TaxID=3069702 RepID=UPI002D2ACD88|nr:ParB/RepB/Spo0J family partition protein [Vitreimonas sp.]HYD89563.1 ParB/RepB/Spo0J family partition protein [Vitreimonas sp.]